MDTKPGFPKLAGVDLSGRELSRRRALWRSLTSFDHSKLTPSIAFRNTVGVVVPIAAGFLLDMPRAGLAVAVGALNTCYSDGSDPYPQRAKRMLTSTMWCSMAVLLGGLTTGHNAEAVVVATIWAFFAGMFVAVGTTAADVGVISLVTLVVYAAQPLSPQQALDSALLALAGGLLQIVLSVAGWPVRRYEPERRALAKVFGDLGHAASRYWEAAQIPPATEAFTLATEVIRPLAGEVSVESVRLRSLMDQAERIRVGLMALSRIRTRIEREKPGHAAVGKLGNFLENAAHVLESIEGTLSADKPIGLRSDRVILGVALAYQLQTEYSSEPGSTFFRAMIGDAQFQMDALSGQFRAALDLAGHASGGGAAAFEKEETRKPVWLRFRSILATLAANLTLRSAAFRHALRLAATLAIGDALGRTFDWRRSYWIPMTIVIVLKPDFSATFSRGVLRILGTATGLLLATALFHVFPIYTWDEIVLIVIFMFLMRWIGGANYGIFAVAVSGLIVLLLTINGVSPREAILTRGFNTCIGGLLALAAYVAWPTWERYRVPDLLAALLSAYRNYFNALLLTYSQTGKLESRELARARQESRTARSNLEASLERLAAEPGTNADDLVSLSAVVASSQRFVHAIMSLEAGLPVTPVVPPRKELLGFGSDISETLTLLERVAHGEHIADKKFPDLRASHTRVLEAGDPEAERYALANIETDRMTNSLNTLREQLRGWLRKRRTRSRQGDASPEFQAASSGDAR